MSLVASLKSETVKLKRTSSSYICFIVALIVPVLMFFESLDEGLAGKAMRWSHFYLEGRELLSFIFLPLYIILVSTLIVQLEYRNNTWKQVLTSPQKFMNVFFSKFMILHLLIIAFLLAYIIYLYIAGICVELIEPEYFNGGINIKQVLIVHANTYLAILGMSAIQFWLALRFKNFIAPLAIGFCLWFFAPIIFFEMKLSMGEYYPYSFTITTVLPKYKGNTEMYLWLSLGYMILFLIIAFLEFNFRKSKT